MIADVVYLRAQESGNMKCILGLIVTFLKWLGKTFRARLSKNARPLRTPGKK